MLDARAVVWGHFDLASQWLLLTVFSLARHRTLETNTHAHFGPGSGVGPDFGLEGPMSFLKPTWLSPLSGPEVCQPNPKP